VEPREAGLAALDYGGGCLVFTPALQQVAWPNKFHFNVPVIYNGGSNPQEFLQIYSTKIVTAGPRSWPTGSRWS
jgi:hypothetical protein